MRRLAFLFLLHLAAACGQGETTSDTSSVVLDSQSSKWPNARAIPVCVMNREEIGDDLYLDVKNYVSTEYWNRTGIRFLGWESCTESQLKSSVIRVQFNRTHNWSSSSSVVAGGGLSMVGKSSRTCGTDCEGGTMRLDIGDEGNYPSPSSRYRSFAVARTRGTAIHEFGHAIGLMHEHERTDVEDCDKSSGRVEAKAPYVYVGDYDESSIMNYCHGDSVTTLSAGDVEGVFYVYPDLETGH